MGADPIGPGGWSQCAYACGALAVRAYGSTVWRGAGVRTVYFMGTTCSVRAASPLASIDPCL